MPSDLKKLNRALGSPFAGLSMLTQAVTHRSYRSVNNERLEFLGDAILDVIIAEELYRRFPEATEGQLSRFRAHLVKRKSLAAVAREFNLGEYLLLGDGEMKSGGTDRDSILADALEAIIGALYLETDMECVRAAVSAWFGDRLDNLSFENARKDAKTMLQEYLQAQRYPLPEYQVVSESGLAHERTFVVECSVAPLERSIMGKGTSRRIAEQEAATQALALLGVADAEQ